jgi:hypothetical protein
MYPSNPSFEFIQSESYKKMVSSAYKVVHNLEKWDFLKEFEPEDTGFMFSNNQTAISIMNHVDEDYQGHSGGTIGLTMRVIQYIAKNGYNEYKKKYLNENDTNCDSDSDGHGDGDGDGNNDDDDNHPETNMKIEIEHEDSKCSKRETKQHFDNLKKSLQIPKILRDIKNRKKSPGKSKAIK